MLGCVSIENKIIFNSYNLNSRRRMLNTSTGQRVQRIDTQSPDVSIVNVYKVSKPYLLLRLKIKPTLLELPTHYGLNCVYVCLTVDRYRKTEINYREKSK